MTLREEDGGEEDQGSLERGEKKLQRGSGTLASLCTSCSKSFLSVLYKSWCLFLSELLRVVTALEVSSASSSSFASRTSVKNLKMVLKLTQEKRSMPQHSLIHPELVVNSSGTPPASPPYPIAVRGHQGGVSVPICR
ncbi:hypothetical protein EPR50_G00049360 [Perca flavescens]|uniref:Uncharacterized protein n=1 Tax=Perca flavescens TaxID=8167 RepID=A0A484DB52_PERFV|nr:hypothetical protein EPR50_G00049360 [Perca flavescens]